MNPSLIIIVIFVIAAPMHFSAAEFAFQSKEPKTRAEFDTVLLSVLFMIE